MKRWMMLGAALLAAACDQEAPTAVGARLLPAEAIRTFEVLLEPEQYLAFDTAFGLYSLPADADFVIIANRYGGVMTSRALLRYDMPRTITVIDAQGVLRTDSAPRYIGADIRMILDTLASTTTPAQFQVFRTTEPWDRTSAGWTLRVDTAGARIPWTVPGGSPGALVSTTSWTAGDTLRLPVDSATLAIWADPANTAAGALVTVATANTRFRSELPLLHVRARSSIRPDTVVEALLAPGRTFIFEPEQPDSTSAPRVGGTPAWRTIMRLRERLDTVTVACPGVASGCRLRIGSTSIAYAALQLQPVPAPPGFEPERPLEVVANAVLPQTRVPLQRSPITDAVGGVIGAVPVSSFTAPGAPVVELIMTDFLRAAFRAPREGELRPSHFALLQSGATRTFGFGTFAERPRLRLVLSVSSALELP